MAKSKRRRARRVRVRQRKDKLSLESAPGPASQADQASSKKSEVPDDHSEVDETAFTFAVRAVGIAPIATLVAILASHDLYPALIPRWFEPIVDEQIAVLTLSAGHAGIIGLLISTRGRFRWSTYSLFIAAAATATVGFRTIGDSTAGHIVAISLFLLIFPAVWPEKLSAKLDQIWRFIWSRKGLFTFLFVATVVLVTYNQSQNENYIRDWMLIPLGIFLGIIVASYLVWLLIKAAAQYIPLLFNLLSSLVRSVYRRATRWRRDSK